MAPFVAERFGELAEGALGGGVGGDGEAALEGEEGAKVDDLASAEGHHVSAGSLAEEPDGLEVDVENLMGVCV